MPPDAVRTSSLTGSLYAHVRRTRRFVPVAPRVPAETGLAGEQFDVGAGAHFLNEIAKTRGLDRMIRPLATEPCRVMALKRFKRTSSCKQDKLSGAGERSSWTKAHRFFAPDECGGVVEAPRGYDSEGVAEKTISGPQIEVGVALSQIGDR